MNTYHIVRIGDPPGSQSAANRGGTCAAWSDSKDKARTETLTVNGLQVTTVDVKGTYSGGMSQDSVPKDSNSIYRLRGAVIETPKGSYFVKLTGPEKTVNHWDQAFSDYIKSFEFK